MQSELIRRQLEQKLAQFRLNSNIERPRSGWLRAIREALGMSRQNIAERLDVTSQNIEAIELSEINDTIMLQSIKRFAEAMDCQVVYAIVPKHPLQEIVNRQMLKKAKQIAGYVSHTMTLEDQKTSDNELNEQVAQIVYDLSHRKNISIIWKE